MHGPFVNPQLNDDNLFHIGKKKFNNKISCKIWRRAGIFLNEAR